MACQAAQKIADKTCRPLSEIKHEWRSTFWTPERKKELADNLANNLPIEPLLFSETKNWESFPARLEWERIYKQAEREHPLYQKPDPDCQNCGGTGKYITTYNPKAKWDWWIAGGRYEGVVGGAVDPNVAPVTVLLEQNIVPFAVVTPDGKWHERGEMGWFAIVTREKEKDVWAKEVRNIFEKHKDCLAVGCDLHI